MLRKSVFLFLTLISSLFLLSSCLKDDFKLSRLKGSFWEPDVAIPLVNASLTLDDVLKSEVINDNISIGSDNFVTLVYRGNLLSVMARDIIKIPEPSSPYTGSFAIAPADLSALDLLPINQQFTLPAFSETLPIDLAPHTIDSMTMKSGVLLVSLTSNLPLEATIELTFPGIWKNGGLLTGSILLPAAAAGASSTASYTFSLAGAHINLNTGPTTGLQLTQVTTFKKVNSDPMPANPTFSYSATYTQMGFSNLYGNFDFSQAQLVPTQDTVAITLFQEALGNTDFQFSNPSLGVRITNSFGLPINASMDVFRTYAPISNPTTVDVTFPFNPFLIPAPTLAQVGQSATVSYSLNNANTNGTLNQALAGAPRFLIYKLNNLPSSPGSGPYFVLDSSRFKVDLDVDLPLEGRVNKLVFQDTVPFTFQDVEELQELSIRASVTNDFPLEARMQIYFADSLGFVADSLMFGDQQILAAGTTNNGTVISQGQKIVDVVYPLARIQNLKRVRKMFVKAITNTAGASTGNNIKIYSTFRLGVAISARAKLKFDL